MKKRLIGIRIAVGMCAALGWWGVLYPELTLTPDTVRVICEEGGKEEAVRAEWAFDNSLFQRLLTADRGTVRVQSRVLQELGIVLEAFHDAD